jgi:hypothetical protein
MWTHGIPSIQVSHMVTLSEVLDGEVMHKNPNQIQSVSNSVFLAGDYSVCVLIPTSYLHLFNSDISTVLTLPKPLHVTPTAHFRSAGQSSDTASLSTIYLLYIMRQFICNISLLHLNASFLLCKILITVWNVHVYMYFIVWLWLTSCPVVIWLTYGSKECNKCVSTHVRANMFVRIYMHVCMHVCM